MSNNQDRRSPHQDGAAYPLSRLPRLAMPHSNYHIINELPHSPPPLPAARMARSRGRPEMAVPAGPCRSDFDFDGGPADRDGGWSVPALLRSGDTAGAPQRHEKFSWSERSTAAFLGFAAGMVVVVPIVFYLSLWTDTRPVTVTPEAGVLAAVAAGSGLDAQRSVRAETRSVTAFGAAPAFASASVADGVWVDVRTDRHQTREHDIEAAARRLMGKGRLAEARVALSKAASPETAQLWFVLAETYDPFIGPADAGIRAEPQTPATPGTHLELARHYYRLALAHGIDAATGRLGALAKESSAFAAEGGAGGGSGDKAGHANR